MPSQQSHRPTMRDTQRVAAALFLAVRFSCQSARSCQFTLAAPGTGGPAAVVSLQAASFSQCQSQAHRSESTGQAAGQAARLRMAKEGQNSNASILIGSCHGVTVAIISHRTEAVPPVPKFSLHTCSQQCSFVRRIAIRGYGWHPGEGTISSRP